MVFFAVQKFLRLIGSRWFMFYFIFIAPPKVGKKKACCSLCQREFSLCFSSKSFVVSGLTFISVIHFEFIFVCGVRECSNFILLHVAVQFSQHQLLKKQSSPLYILASFVIGEHSCMDLSLGFLSCSVDLYF